MNYKVATNWNELNTWQMQKFAKYIFSGIPKDSFKYKAVYILFLGKQRLWRYFKWRYLIARVPFQELLKHTDFIFKSTERTQFPKYLQLGFKKFYGPSNRLTNLTIDQFSMADMFYYRWCKKRETTDLNRLVSILYLPKGKEFSRDDLGHSIYVRLFSREKKLGILLAFMGSRELLAKKFKHVFPKGSGSGKYESFDKIVYNMARGESKPFGGVYKTKDARLYDFMNVLDDELADQKEFKRKHGGSSKL